MDQRITDNMDTVLEPRKGIRRKHIPYIAGGAFLLAVLLWLVLGNHAMKMSIEAKRLNIGEITRGEFNDYVRINGQVMPISTIQLSAFEGGMVEEKLVEEGLMVKRGDVIVRLTNPNLSLNILDSEAQLAEKQNFLRNTQVTMEQEKLNLRREKLQLDTEVRQKKRKYEQFKQLYDERLVSKEDYLQAQENFDLAVNGRTLVIERQKQDSLYRSIQVDQMEESLGNMQQNLRLVRQRFDNLSIKAPIDGQLGLLDVEIGQMIGMGDKIGQISVLSDFKVEAMIDEHYIDRVRQGLSATFERQDKGYSLRVRKVFPEVRNKQFKTEFVFEGERPDNIRAGQTYYISLQLGQPTDAVLIPRGTFYQNTGGKWIFVLTPDGNRAVRREISIGRQNPTYYEVTSGLEPGERVIVSGYDLFGDVQQLILK